MNPIIPFKAIKIGKGIIITITDLQLAESTTLQISSVARNRLINDTIKKWILVEFFILFIIVD